MNSIFRAALLLGGTSLVLSGCGGSNGSGSTADRGVDGLGIYSSAAISTVSSGFDASEIAVVDLDADDLEVDAVVYESAESDISLATNGGDFYRLGRNNIDAIAKYSVNNNVANQWEYSSKDDTESSANVYDLVFVNDTKAYMLRYGSEIAWIVNPQATTEEAFKIGELDLSAYSDSDGLPEVAGGVIADGKLFVIMQRVDRDNGWVPSNTSYVAVFDVTTDEEIATGQGGDLDGIALETRNPLSIDYLEGVGLFVQSMGPFWGDDYTGGIEEISLSDYSTDYLLDDGDAADHPYDRVNQFSVVNDSSAYFVSYAGWQSTTLMHIDPMTGVVADAAVAGLEGIDIRAITRGPEGNLWVAIADLENPRVVVIDPETDTIIDTIETDLNPTKIGFTSVD